ncbi:hypothetical protein BKA60DRAFT_653925 [Fusarium oxysporum]|nr:hypothetical protein BKA60DRAFT_653925 [Fusarium oxysporum]
MSFGYGVCDVIAVLGLCERVAIELRNYKDTPMQFQQLQTSLGHFKTTKNLSSIGTRLHWSMVGLADVQELRETVISQMVAINVLLILQQQTSIRRLTVQSQANFITRHAKTLFHLMQDIKRLFFFLARCSREMLEATSKNMWSIPSWTSTRTLLDIRVQLKHIISAIEVIPLHLTLDIVRLDDVHGESWALPLQTCRTWESFKEILQFVVYANEGPGAKCITHNLFATAQAKTGKKVDHETWETMIEPGFHLEQAVVLKVDHFV